MDDLLAEATFKVAYDGEAIADGEMEVSDLAPALLGIAELLKAAGRVIDGDDSSVSVRVRATNQACFEVWLSVVVKGIAAGWEFLKTPDGQAASSLLGLLGITGTGITYGAIALVKKLKGKKPNKITKKEGGLISLELDGVIFEVPEIVARIAFDSAVRNAMEKAISNPLQKEGIDKVRLGDTNCGEIHKEEAEYFFAPALSSDDEFVSRYTKAFSIVQLSFKSGPKWKLSDGHGPAKFVTVNDGDFIKKVDRSEVAFAKGDLLICEVVETSRRTAAGFKSEYEIIKVVEHRRPPSQSTLNW